MVLLCTPTTKSAAKTSFQNKSLEPNNRCHTIKIDMRHVYNNQTRRLQSFHGRDISLWRTNRSCPVVEQACETCHDHFHNSISLSTAHTCTKHQDSVTIRQGTSNNTLKCQRGGTVFCHRNSTNKSERTDKKKKQGFVKEPQLARAPKHLSISLEATREKSQNSSES